MINVFDTVQAEIESYRFTVALKDSMRTRDRF